MNNQIEIFKNEELKLQIRAIQNDDGSISLNAEDTAIGFGWIKVEKKNGKEYKSVRWERMYDFCKEIGFDHKWAKDDYIPESLFYMLGMKASNKVAQEFQKWLAVKVIPSIRKNGTYSINEEKVDKLTEMETETKLNNSQTRKANSLMRMHKQCNDPVVKDLLFKKAIETLTGKKLITNRKTYSAEEIGKKFNISANRVGRIANANNLKTEQYGEMVGAEYNNKAQGPTFRYYDTVIPVIEDILRGKNE